MVRWSAEIGGCEEATSSQGRAQLAAESVICMASLLLLLGAIMQSQSNDVPLIDGGTKDSNYSNADALWYERKHGTVFSGASPRDYLWSFPSHSDIDHETQAWKVAVYGIWP
ncbi:hypothetical protein ACLB2K_002178 [Fragaria x ananassa]